MAQNSKECEWQDCALYLNGALITKIQGWDYRKIQQKDFLHAAGNDPYSIQRGQCSYLGNFQLLKNAVDAIRRAVQLAGGSDITDARFLVVLSYAAKGTRLLQTDTMFGLEFTEDPRQMSNASTSSVVSVPFMFTQLKSI